MKPSGPRGQKLYSNLPLRPRQARRSVSPFNQHNTLLNHLVKAQGLKLDISIQKTVYI